MQLFLKKTNKQTKIEKKEAKHEISSLPFVESIGICK